MKKIKRIQVLVIAIATTVLLACSEEHGSHGKDSLALVDSERAAKRYVDVMAALRADSACQYLKGLPGRWPDVFSDSVYMHGDDSCVINIVDSVFSYVFEVKNQIFQKELNKLISRSDGYLSEYMSVKFIEQMSINPISTLQIVEGAYSDGLNAIPLCLIRTFHFEIRQIDPEFDSSQIKSAFSNYLNKKNTKNGKEFVQRMYDSIFSKSDYIWKFD